MCPFLICLDGHTVSLTLKIIEIPLTAGNMYSLTRNSRLWPNIKILQMALALSLEINLDMYTWKHTGQDIHYSASFSGQGQE